MTQRITKEQADALPDSEVVKKLAEAMTDQSSIILWALGFSFTSGFVFRCAFSLIAPTALLASYSAGYFLFESVNIMMELFP